MTTHSATTDTSKTWWTIGSGAAAFGAAGVGWSLADVAGAAAAGGAVLAGVLAIRWAMTQRQPAPPGETAATTGHAPGRESQTGHGPDWAAPKLAGFYKSDAYKSDTRTALTDSGTKSGMFVVKAPRSRTGTDL